MDRMPHHNHNISSPSVSAGNLFFFAVTVMSFISTLNMIGVFD